jgi:hypothetical protein
MSKNIKLHYTFSHITEELEQDLKSLVDYNVNWKLDNYFKKIYNKDWAEIKIDIRMLKNKQDKFEWSFEFVLDWEKIMYKNDVPFKNPDDLVNHAFDHLKRELSDK